MSYIGVQPGVGQYRKLDDISGSFNGSTTTFTTSVAGENVTAISPQQLIVSVGGVIQQPVTDYTTSTNSIIFSTAPGSGLDFFAVLMGDALNIGTPSDGSVTTAKLGADLTVDLDSGSAAAPSLTFDSNTGIYSPGADQVAISTNGTAAVTVDSSQRVGVGTTPVVDLDVAPAASAATFRIHARSDTTPVPAIELVRGTNTTFGADGYGDYRIKNDAGNLAFEYGDTGVTTERVRIDSSGRLLVGTTSASTGAKVQIQGNSGSPTSYGYLAVKRGSIASGANDDLAYITFEDSSSNQGAWIQARRDGGTWTSGSSHPTFLAFSTTADGAASPTERMRIENDGKIRFPSALPLYQAGGSGIYLGNTGLFSTDGSGTLQDNTRNIGSASLRWATVYAGTGTINTSDANLKQDVTALEQAELQVASTIKGLIKKFRFIDAVADKGDDARIHVGVIAQEIEQAFINEGLDPRRYGLFCEDTLEDGSKRLGIRYDELLAFVIAAL